MSKLKGKSAIVTGASSGIGEACARELASRGVNLCLAARNLERLDKVAAELRQKGVTVITRACDVSIEKDCLQLIESAITEFKKLDILINNAGLSMRAILEDAELSVIRNLMEVNFFGMVYCTKFALPHLLKSRGSVVGMSSIAGFRGLPARTGYSASKFAMQGFLESLRTETLHQGLHVMVACPGFTASNIRNSSLNASGNAQGESPRDEGKMMSAEEVARHVIGGIAKRKRTVILTTQGKLTVLLNKIIPGRMDHIVYNHMAKEANSPIK